MTELTEENRFDVLAKVPVRIERIGPEQRSFAHYQALHCYPEEEVPAAMLYACARLREQGFYSCDNTCPNHVLSVFDMAWSRGLHEVKHAVLVLRRRGFELEPCPDFQI